MINNVDDLSYTKSYHHKAITGNLDIVQVSGVKFELIHHTTKNVPI